MRGRVIFVGQPETGVSKSSGKQWSKQMFAIETEGPYPKKVAFGVMNNKFTMNMGDTVEIEVDAQSREYNGKWYTDLTAWRFSNLSAQPAAQPAPQQPVQQPVYQQQAPQGYAPAPQAPAAPTNDLPF